MLTDLVQIRRLAEAKAAENLDFRRYLQAHHRADAAFYAAARPAEAAIDCTACANCCRQLRAGASDTDLARLAAWLKLSPAQTRAHFLEPDPSDHAPVLKHVDGACVFLEHNRCSVYEARPDACRDFPHFHTPGHSLGSRMASIFSKAWLCPIVYNAVEDYKKLLGYHPRAH